MPSGGKLFLFTRINTAANSGPTTAVVKSQLCAAPAACPGETWGKKGGFHAISEKLKVVLAISRDKSLALFEATSWTIMCQNLDGTQSCVMGRLNGSPNDWEQIGIQVYPQNYFGNVSPNGAVCRRIPVCQKCEVKKVIPSKKMTEWTKKYQKKSMSWCLTSEKLIQKDISDVQDLVLQAGAFITKYIYCVIFRHWTKNSAVFWVLIYPFVSLFTCLLLCSSLSECPSIKYIILWLITALCESSDACFLL